MSGYSLPTAIDGSVTLVKKPFDANEILVAIANALPRHEANTNVAK
jgi:hypothetical protein